MSDWKVSTLEDAFCVLLVQCMRLWYTLMLMHYQFVTQMPLASKLSEQESLPSVLRHHLYGFKAVREACASRQYQAPNNVGPKRLLVADSLYNFRCKRNLKVKVDICVVHAT